MRSYPASSRDLKAWIYEDSRALAKFRPSLGRARMLIDQIYENASLLLAQDARAKEEEERRSFCDCLDSTCEDPYVHLARIEARDAR